MTYKKILIVFLIFFILFGVTNVFAAENINVTSSSVDRMQADIDYFKQLLKNNNINNMDDLKSFFGASSVDDIQYFYIEEAGHYKFNYQYVVFYNNFDNISTGVDNYNYYGIQQNSFTFYYYSCLRYMVNGSNSLEKIEVQPNIYTNIAPFCWSRVKTSDLFTMDSSQIIENTLTQDNSEQNDINLGSHNGEMNDAGDTIKNSNLYNKFSNLSNELQEALIYNDNEVLTLPINFNNKNYVLKGNEISYALSNNGLGFVITLWHSILWFSLFYTMFIFIRKIYKAVSGGNPVDDVQKTLSDEDNKMVGGF